MWVRFPKFHSNMTKEEMGKICHLSINLHALIVKNRYGRYDTADCSFKKNDHSANFDAAILRVADYDFAVGFVIKI